MSDTTTTPRLKQDYNKTIAPDLLKELKLKNFHQVPRLEKIIISVGLGKQKEDKKMFEVAENTLLKITGQKPIITYAKQSIASFKLREGQKLGMKVTLRDARMYEFLDRLINIVLPRLRDFHGVGKKSFDSQGNYNIGVIDQSIFPELSFEETTNTHGIQVTIVIANSDIEHSRALLTKLGMPFEKERK